ncbi:unnamed protein product [Rodentolepis nana]|uniref:ABC transporter domain-containing protein n=1 Tax=Rodentolepis nana TaxID=102285 RepID=A0A0R3U0Q4_RODNA|nr:unnamed protein product [Rodentolepis nana]
MNRFSNDVSIADHQLMISFRSMTNTFFGCMVTLALSIIPSPYIFIFLAVLIGFYGFIQVLFVATRRQLQRLDSVSKSPIFSHFVETLHGTETIRAYGLCDLFVSTNDARIDANNRALYSVISTTRWVSIMLETVGNLLTLATSVAFVAATREGGLDPGLAGLVISFTFNVTQSLSWFVRMSAELETNVVSVESILEYSELAIEAPWNVPDKQPPPQWPEGGIEFINYSTRYREDLDLVLKSISVSIKPSEKIGIVGRTGSGKSSLVLALFRIIEPTGGEIRLDGINISEIGLHDIRGRITLIPQDPVLFSGTLRFNLDPFSNYTDEAIWEALSTANLRSFVDKTSSEGLNMPISEGGGNLRLTIPELLLICLARALLRRSRILVLDEATAAVDPHTDRLIQQAVRTEFADSTIGIVGRTGSGKSSLVLALFRIIEPTGGEIRLDGINISEIGLHDIRGRITLIPQDPVLFSGTLRFNLDPFSNYTDEAIWEALSTANLRSFVDKTSSEGLNMPISEGGGNLRLTIPELLLICLARALLRRSRILVLDEATAAVDPHTDRLIQQAVRTEFADSTVLTIAHRLNTILDYDRIMVLDAGQLVEIGSPSELASRPDSIFRGMLKESNLLRTSRHFAK